MRKKKKKQEEEWMHDQAYLDYLASFEEWYYEEVPDVQESDEEDEAVWIITRTFYDIKNSIRRNESIYGAFKTKAEAECYLRKIKHTLLDNYKCYMSYSTLTARNRDNIEHVCQYNIEKVDFIK